MPLLVKPFQPGETLRGLGLLAGQRIHAPQLQIKGIKQATLLETGKSNLGRSRARGKPPGMKGGGTPLGADRGLGLSSFEVMPEGVVLIGGFLSGVTGKPGNRGGGGVGGIPGQREWSGPRLNSLRAGAQTNREGSVIRKEVGNQTAIFNERLKVRAEEEEVALSGSLAGRLNRVAPPAVEKSLQFKPPSVKEGGQGRQVTKVMIEIPSEEARTFDLGEKASAGIVEEEVGPGLGAQVSIAASPAVGIDAVDPLVAEEVGDSLDPRGRVHVRRDKSGKFPHRVRTKGEDAGMFADQGPRAAGLHRVASQAVDTGVGGLNTSGGLQLLAEVVQPPDREVTFLDKPGDSRLQEQTGLVSNARRIG